MNFKLYNQNLKFWNIWILTYVLYIFLNIFSLNSFCFNLSRSRPAKTLNDQMPIWIIFVGFQEMFHIFMIIGFINDIPSREELLNELLNERSDTALHRLTIC